MTGYIKGFVLAAVAALGLAGCGGGGGGGNNGSSPPPSTDNSTYSFTATVQLLAANGQPTTNLTEGAPVTAQTRVIETRTQILNGQTISGSGPAVGSNVTFETSGGSLTPATGTAITNSDGYASVVMTPGTAAGAFTLSVSAIPPPNISSGSVSSGSIQASVNYEIDTTFVPTLSALTIEDVNGNATQSLPAGASATVQVKATRVTTSATGTPSGTAPAAGVIVTFASDGGVFDPSNGEALTDANGIAFVHFLANVVDGPSVMTATATIDGQDVTVSQSYAITVPQVKIGSGNPFQEGVLAIGDATISAGGRTTVSAEIINPDGTLYLPPVPVTFTSRCALSDSASLTTPVVTSNGLALTTYVAKAGCIGQDTITASALIPGSTLPLQATGNVTILAPSASNISFVSAAPTSIVLKGFGSPTRPEQASVTFVVSNAAAIPVPGQRVDFTLTSYDGGLSLIATSGLTDVHGQVVATVQAGSVPLIFRVIATIHGTSISTESDQLTVSTGTPDQNGFSISATTLNVEGWNIDGVTSSLNIRASDRFRNPVPDGTSILFTAQGGSIQPSCQTQDGGCSVTWTTQAPRPQNGRVNILARALGDESFVDLNGTGQFERGDTWGDLPDAFVDYNENRVWDAGEPFYDPTGGPYHGPNGLYDGSTCDLASGLCGARDIDVRANIELVMASSNAVISVSPSPINVGATTSQGVSIAVKDINGNMMPAGTTITVATTAGTLSGTNSFTVGNTSGRGPFVAQVIVSGTTNTTASSGVLTVTVTSPSGVVTTYQVTVNDYGTTGVPPGGCTFSPCGTTSAAQVSAIAVNPTALHVDAGQSVHRAVSLLAADARGLPVDGVTAVVACNAHDSSGLDVHVIESGSSDREGRHPFVLNIVASEQATGSMTCTIRAGMHETSLPVVVDR